MKGTKVKYKQFDWEDDYIDALVLSEPYPVITSIDHKTRNGNTYAGISSSTCVLVEVNGAIVEAQISSLTLTA